MQLQHRTAPSRGVWVHAGSGSRAVNKTNKQTNKNKTRGGGRHLAARRLPALLLKKRRKRLEEEEEGGMQRKQGGETAGRDRKLFLPPKKLKKGVKS